MIATLGLNPKLIAAVLIAWALSLAVAGGLTYAFMAGKHAGIAATATAEAQKACAEAATKAAESAATAQADAITAAREQWEGEQAAMDRLAAFQRERTAAELDRAQARADTLSRQLLAHIHANPPRADGRADPERVRLWNEARRPDPAAGAP